MVRVNTIEAPDVDVESPDGIMYNLNEYEFMDLRIQIAEEKASGWKYWDNDGCLYDIRTDGTVYPYPPQFELFDKLLNKLAGWGEPKVEQCVIIHNNVDDYPNIFYTGPINIEDIASAFSAYYSEEKSKEYAQELIDGSELYINDSSNNYYVLEKQ